MKNNLREDVGRPDHVAVTRSNKKTDDGVVGGYVAGQRSLKRTNGSKD